jgi:uncharacterized protein YeaO (DUF488 family)
VFQIKRVYAAPATEDGFRILVDRLWPRGLTKATAGVGLWLPEVAPSTRLRAWFDHDPDRWSAFVDRYREELLTPERLSSLARLRHEEQARGNVTLLFAARDDVYNHAVILLNVLAEPVDPAPL